MTKRFLTDTLINGDLTVTGVLDAPVITELFSDISDVASDLDDHITDSTGAHAASAISYDPSGGYTITVEDDVQEAIFALDWLASGTQGALSAHLYDTIDAHAASAISYDGATGISATNVEGAIDELAAEKVNKAGDTMTGTLEINTGSAVNAFAAFGGADLTLSGSGPSRVPFRVRKNSDTKTTMISGGVIQATDAADTNATALTLELNPLGGSVTTGGDLDAGGAISSQGNITADSGGWFIGNAIRLDNTTDASLSSTGHAFQIGPSSGTNLIMDNNEIFVRDTGDAGILHIHRDGGEVTFGSLTPLSNFTINGTSMITTTSVSVTSNLTVTSGWTFNTFNIRQVTPNLFQFQISITNNTGGSLPAGNHGNVTICTVNNTGNGARIRGTNNYQCILASGSSGAQIGTYVPSTGALQLVWSGDVIANAGSATLFGLVVVN